MPDCNCFLTSFYINNRNYRVLLSDSPRRAGKQTIYISPADIDPIWYRDVKRCADYTPANDENTVYLKLFILYSLKQRVRLADLESILGIDVIEKECVSKNIFEYYFNKLSAFMSLKNYPMNLIKALIPFYRRGMVPSDCICNALKKTNNSRAFDYIRFWKAEQRIKYRLRQALLRTGRNISRCRAGCMLKKRGFNKIKVLPISSFSGSLFLEAVGQNGEKYFIKSETLFSDSLSPEYIAAKRINTSDSELYVTPITELSERDCLIYTYNEQKTLADIICVRKLCDAEIKVLESFFLAVIDNLSSKKIVHRDITPANIIIDIDNNLITTCRLTDFGTAAIDGVIPQGIKREREINNTAGSNYRFSDAEWNDAMSSWLILLSSAGRESDYIHEALSTILNHRADYNIAYPDK